MTAKLGIEYNVATGEAVVGSVRFGPIEGRPGATVEHDPDRERTADGRYEFRGRHPYPGLVMSGRRSALTARRCSVCGQLVRGSSMRSHAGRHLREGTDR